MFIIFNHIDWYVCVYLSRHIKFSVSSVLKTMNLFCSFQHESVPKPRLPSVLKQQNKENKRFETFWQLMKVCFHISPSMTSDNIISLFLNTQTDLKLDNAHNNLTSNPLKRVNRLNASICLVISLWHYLHHTYNYLHSYIWTYCYLHHGCYFVHFHVKYA